MDLKDQLGRFLIVDDLCKECHSMASSKGFYRGLQKDNQYHISTKLMLIVSEVSEAVEELRKGGDKLPEELADVAIRLFDLCGFLGINLGREIEKKMIKNQTRDKKHGKKF